MSDTYFLVLIIHILATFQRVTITVGNNGGGIHNVIPDARSGGAGIRDIMASGRNGCLCTYYKRLLETRS